MKFPSRCSSIHSPPVSRLVKHGKQHYELHIVPGPLLGLPIPAVRLYSGRCCTAVQCTHSGHRSHSVWARASLRQHRHRRANCKILLYKLKKYFLHLQHGWTGASGLVLEPGLHVSGHCIHASEMSLNPFKCLKSEHICNNRTENVIHYTGAVYNCSV